MKEYSSPEIQFIFFDTKMDVVSESAGDNTTDWGVFE